MTFNMPQKFAGTFFKRYSRIACGLLVMLAFAAPLQAVDLLYVTLNNNTIVSYDTTGNVGTTIAASVTTFASTYLNSPQGLAADSLGNIFVANHGDNTINKFNSTGSYVSSITTNISLPVGLAVDSKDNLYAANYGNGPSSNHTISKFDYAGVYVDSIDTAAYLNSPIGIALDLAGNIYAANFGNYSISKFNSAGVYQPIGSIDSTYLNSPQGLAADSLGNIFVANYGDSTIRKYNDSSVYLYNITTNLSGPVGLAFDTLGNLYAANWGNNTISKFDSSGTFLTSWSTGASPLFLAFKPVSVPEPSTYALAAIATGVMAYLARRRKSRSA
jgi:sugar lactone lactonase YvrE